MANLFLFEDGRSRIGLDTSGIGTLKILEVEALSLWGTFCCQVYWLQMVCTATRLVVEKNYSARIYYLRVTTYIDYGYLLPQCLKLHEISPWTRTRQWSCSWWSRIIDIFSIKCLYTRFCTVVILGFIEVASI